MARRRGPRSPKDLTQVDELLDRSAERGFLRFVSNRARLTDIWRETVGEKVAAKTSIRSFELGKMTVEVAGPAYMERYRYQLQAWRKRINIEFGDELVTEIVLRVGQA